MVMFHTLLVPLDGSPACEQAVPEAARLAKAASAALHLAHVHSPYSSDPIAIEGMPVIDAELHSLASEHERVYLERIAATVADERLRPQIDRLEGPVVPTLTAHAHLIGADLIVLTSHGRSGFTHFWLGSVAEHLIRTALIPMLLLRPHPDRHAAAPIRRILVPLDGSTLAEQILPVARKLALLNGAELHLLRVVDALIVPQGMPYAELYRLDDESLAQQHAEAAAYLERVAAQLRSWGGAVSAEVISAETPALAILDIARSGGADLIAIATHGRGGLARMVMGSVADKLLRGCSLPMLILRPADV